MNTKYILSILCCFAFAMNNVSSEEDLEPLSADISKFWLFKCDFCLNLAAAKNEIVCEDSRECTEIFSLCDSFYNQCCVTDKNDECLIAVKKSSLQPLDFVNDNASGDKTPAFYSEKRMLKKRMLRKKKLFVGKRKSIYENDPSSFESDEINEENFKAKMKKFRDDYEKKSLKRIFPFKKRF